MTTQIRRLGPDDLALVVTAPADLFDEPVRPEWAAAFLADPRHHLIGAIHQGSLIGFTSSVDYLHPDKPRTLWINEVGVVDAHQRQGHGRALMLATLAHGWAIGCAEAWVLTESGNRAARGLYAAAGGTATPAARAAAGVIMYSFLPPSAK